MILIFGLRSYVKVLATLTLACRQGHVAAHRLVKVTRKFSLFFVPVFPAGRSRYFTVCAQCGLQMPWDRETAEAAAQQHGAGFGTVGAGAGVGPVGGPGAWPGAGPGSVGGRGAWPGAGPGSVGSRGAWPGDSGVHPGADSGLGSGLGPALPPDPVAPPLRPVTSLPLAAPTARPGWYPDPAGESDFRYWDGSAWTAAVHEGPVA
jgi:hypothetical protein